MQYHHKLRGALLVTENLRETGADVPQVKMVRNGLWARADG